MRIGIGTKRGSFPITILLTFNIPFIFYDGIAINRELNGVDVTANDVEVPTFGPTTDCKSGKVDESTTGLASSLRTQIS
jgi:hypothetical protein